MAVRPARAPEVAKKKEQVAPTAVEVAVLPVPAAPTMSKKKNQPKVVEADHSARSLRAWFQSSYR